jgi:hypothetical protein
MNGSQLSEKGTKKQINEKRRQHINPFLVGFYFVRLSGRHVRLVVLFPENGLSSDGSCLV